jgi:hypothetical protein
MPWFHILFVLLCNPAMCWHYIASSEGCLWGARWRWIGALFSCQWAFPWESGLCSINICLFCKLLLRGLAGRLMLLLPTEPELLPWRSHCDFFRWVRRELKWGNHWNLTRFHNSLSARAALLPYCAGRVLISKSIKGKEPNSRRNRS